MTEESLLSYATSELVSQHHFGGLSSQGAECTVSNLMRLVHFLCRQLTKGVGQLYLPHWY